MSIFVILLCIITWDVCILSSCTCIRVHIYGSLGLINKPSQKCGVVPRYDSGLFSFLYLDWAHILVFLAT